MNLLIVYVLVFLLFVVTYCIGKNKKKHDFLDIIWGFSFVLAVLSAYIISDNKTTVGVLMTLLVAVWGLRLTYHLAKRNINKKEDYRYEDYRKKYKGKHFDLYFFFRMYVLQFMLSILISFPAVHINTSGDISISALTYLGIIIWGIGFFFEAVSDYQLKKFIVKPENKDKLMMHGLWRYTRHPNYFGEATQWWGIYLMALSNINYFWLIFSPLLITLLLLFVSGIPMLEKRYEGRKDWETYKAKTSVFFPLPPRR